MTFVPLIAGPPSMGGVFWVTPGEARAEQESVNTAVQQLDRDVRATMVSQEFATAWAAWKREWDAFFDDQGSVTGWLTRFATGGSYEKTVDYRRQLEGWRARFEQLGGAPTSPGLPKVPPPTNVADAARYVAITAGIVGALWVASTVYKETRGRL